MLYWKVSLFLCCSLHLIPTQQKELPNYIEKCSLKHDFKQCVIRSSKKAIPLFVKGDPEHNIPNMQPLHVPFVGLINTNQLVLNFTDTKVYGLENAKLVDLIIDKEQKLSFNSIFKNSNITMKGQYSSSGNILTVPLNGKGMYTVTLLNGVYTYPLVIEEVTKNGESYYKTRGKDLGIDIENAYFDIGNFFEGDEQLGKLVNRLFNENWRVLLEEFRPAISGIVTTIITDIFNQITNDVPSKTIFLPD